MMNGSQYHPTGGIGNRGDTSIDENATYHTGAEPDIPGLKIFIIFFERTLSYKSIIFSKVLANMMTSTRLIGRETLQG